MMSPEPRATRRGGGSFLALGVIAIMLSAGCRSTAPPVISAEDRPASVEALTAPLPGDPAALYRLRVPSTSGLRLSLVTSGDDGRMTIAESFGSAVSLTAWSGIDRPTFFDLREGCMIESVDLSRVLGIAAMPMPQAVRLLSGRLPAVPADRLAWSDDGRLEVVGNGWAATIVLAANPWRVVSVSESTPSGKGWRLELSDHDGPVPGTIGIKKPGQRWVELELVRIEWKDGRALRELPNLPDCRSVQ